METRVIKKTHHSRSISAIRPTKGSKTKKPKPVRYEFKLVPLPEKYTKSPKMYHLYADVILLEREETLCLEASLYNYYKVYKHIEIEKHPFQRVVRMHVENKEEQFDDWRKVVDELTNSPSLKLRPWAGLVKGYCERYEEMIKGLREKMPAEKEAQLNEINTKTQKIRQLLVNTYPLVEYKSELRNGQIELTQVSMSEKYLAESGYTVDEFIKIVFQDGLPEFLPLDAAGSSWIAKMRLERFLTIDAGGFQTPEMENYLVMKNGSLRMAKFTTHYYTTFENGIPGFVFFGTMTGRPKPCTGPVMQVERRRVSKDFMNQSFEKDDNQTDFLEMFYGDRAENR